MNKENIKMDIIKLIWAYCIALYHAQIFYPSNHFISGHFAVNYFFVISGFFMCKKFYESKDIEPRKYLSKRFIPMIPWVMISGCIILVEQLVFSDNKREVIYNAFLSIWEVLLVRMGGLSSGMNGLYTPAWYLSSLFLATIFLIPYIRLVHTKHSYMTILVVVLGLGYINHVQGSLSGDIYYYCGFMYMAVFKAIIEMMLGFLAFDFALILRNKEITPNSYLQVLLVILEVLGYTISIVYLYFAHNRLEFETFMIFIIAFTLSITFSKRKLIGRTLESKINGNYIRKLSFGIYMTHAIIVNYFMYYVDYIQETYEYLQFILLYVLIITAVGVLATYILEKINNIIIFKVLEEK